MNLLVPIISGLGILGFNTQNKKKNPRNINVRKDMSQNDIPSGDNIYNSVYTKEASKAERELSEAKYIQSRDPASTNVIPPFYNDMCASSLGCSLSLTPLKGAGNNIVTPGSSNSGVQSMQNVGSILPSSSPLNSQDNNQARINKIMSSPMFQSSMSGNVSPIDNSETLVKEAFTLTGPLSSNNQVSELSGAVFDGSHNNMVPFFGANLKQNVDPNKSQSLLDRYTGNDRHLQKNKIESGPMFKPQQQNIFGTAVSQDRSRFYQSNLKTSLLPLPQVREAPLPPDAFRGQYKSVDQLRVKPKITNKTGTPIEGVRVAINTQPLAYNKNKPETAYKSSSGRSFVGRAGLSGQTERLNYTNGRQSATENEGFIPAAKSFNEGKVQQIRTSDALDLIDDSINGTLFSISTDDRRHSDKNTGFRNAGRTDSKGDYNREGYHQPNETERDTTSTMRFNSCTQRSFGKRYRNNQRSRTTNKEGTLFSYTGDAMSNTKGNRGSQGSETRKTNRLTIKNYTRNGGDRRGYINTDPYEKSEIRSNRESISNRKNYDLEYKIGSRIDSGADAIGSVRLRNDDHHYDRLGNIEAVYNNTARNYGRSKTKSNKDYIEDDREDRIGAEFTRQLMGNEFNHDISKPKKRKKIIRQTV